MRENKGGASLFAAGGGAGAAFGTGAGAGEGEGGDVGMPPSPTHRCATDLCAWAMVPMRVEELVKVPRYLPLSIQWRCLRASAFDPSLQALAQGPAWRQRVLQLRFPWGVGCSPEPQATVAAIFRARA